MVIAQRVFLVAGIYGLLVLGLSLGLEQQIALNDPPPITHPEFFYGFIAVGLAWQVAFLVIATDPVRYRPLMIPAMLEKAGFLIACIILYCMSRINIGTMVMSLIDGMFLCLFIWAFMRTPPWNQKS